MFGKKKHDTSNIATLIGAGTRVTGDVAFRGRLHLDGVVEGDVTGEAGASVLVIGGDGLVEGAVQVDELILNGAVRGDVAARERVELGASSRVDGNVAYKLLQMSAGGCVNGRLVHQPGGQQALPAPEGDASAPEVG